MKREQSADGAMSQAILDAITAQIAVLDRNGTIVAVNESWRRFAIQNSNEPGRPAPNTGVGTSYLAVCQASGCAPAPDAAAIGVAEGIRAVLTGRQARYACEYPCHAPDRQRWFSMDVTPLGTAHGGVVVSHSDVTEGYRALREKEALLKEVHHRVKNNLQLVTSLLRLEGGRSQQPETRDAFLAMQGRIRSMALLHESLYRSGSFAAVDLGVHLGQIATQAFDTMRQGGVAVLLQLSVAPVPIAMQQAIPCGLLVNELVSNSLKHGFPEGRGGEVRVALEKLDGAAKLRVLVSDTGVGLPPDFAARRMQSLGLQLVSDLARQLRGTLEIGPEPRAVFSVTFTPDAALRGPAMNPQATHFSP